MDEGSEDTTSGTWSSDGCHLKSILSSQVVFTCTHLSHYGLLQDVSSLLHRGAPLRGADFKPSAPAVYLGSFLCVAFLVITIITWATHHPHIRTTDNNKHSYVNTWIAIVLLVSLFTAGVYQTENNGLCQSVGIVLHYLSSCVLLWIIVSVTNLYKKVIKALRPPLLSDDPPPDGPLPPKPMLRFYLVGWGIAMILCGISAAVNLHHYAGYSYCFLAWGPSLGAFYAPCVILVAILGVFCLLTHCMLKSVGPGTYSEAAATTTETTELELLDTASPNSENPTTHSGHTSSHITGHLNADRLPDDELSIAGSDSSSSLYDTHHSPLTQLRSHEVTLLLFVLTWASAAITTAAPFEAVIPFHTTIFSLVYAVCATSLGVFIFLFFCFGRTDVKQAWKATKILAVFRRKAEPTILHLTVANNAGSNSGSGGSGAHLIPPVSNANAANLHNVITNNSNTNNNSSNNLPRHMNNNSSSNSHSTPRVAAPPSVHSVDSSRSPTNKSSSVSHQVGTPNKNENLLKNENVRQQGTSLHLLNLGTVTDNLHYSPEMFYNPKQAGVAKRFFQKQRLKQMVKQNNLGLQRENDSDCNSSVLYRPRPARSNNSGSDVSGFDPSCLGASSKVNNTNIHVDHNIYSYMSCNKQADKTPTPELLCVFGPNKDYTKEYDDRQKRSFSRSPNQTDHIPRIDATSVYQYSSESSYQTPTHQKIHPIRHLENLEIDNVNTISYRGQSKFSDMNRNRQQSPFNCDTVVEETENLCQQQAQQQLVRCLPVPNKEQAKPKQTRVRHKRARSKGAAAAAACRDDWSDDNIGTNIRLESLPATAREHGLDAGLPGSAEIPVDYQSLSSTHNTSSSPLQLPRDKLQAEASQAMRLMTPSPLQAVNVRKFIPNSPVGNKSDKPTSPAFNRDVNSIMPLINSANSNISPVPTKPASLDRLRSYESGGAGVVSGQPHHSWPHVLASGIHNSIPPVGTNINCNPVGGGLVRSVKRHNIPWHENLQAVTSWDSETGEEMSSCEGGGEKRFSAGDISDQLSVCGTDNTSRNSMCSDVSIDGSSLGTSLVAGIDTSPPASLLVSDSPFDSPLHRLHQNTPDDASVASIASSSMTSPVRRPFSPSNFPYFRNDGGLGMFDYNFTYDPSDLLKRKDSNKKLQKNEKTARSYSGSPVREKTPTNMPESSSVGRQLSSIAKKKKSRLPSIFTKRSKACKAAPQQPEIPMLVPNFDAASSGSSLRAILDPILDVNFQFSAACNSAEEDDREEECTSAFATDRSSSVSTELQHQQMLMTTPRSEGSSDSDYHNYTINQEPPINLMEDIKKVKKRTKTTKKKGEPEGISTSCRDRIYEDEELSTNVSGSPSRESLNSTPTASTPLLSVEQEENCCCHPSVSSQCPTSPPPLAPFFAPPPPDSPYKPLSTSTPVRQEKCVKKQTSDAIEIQNDQILANYFPPKPCNEMPEYLLSSVTAPSSSNQQRGEDCIVQMLPTPCEIKEASMTVPELTVVPLPKPSPVPISLPKPSKASISMPSPTNIVPETKLSVLSEVCGSPPPPVPARVSRTISLNSHLNSRALGDQCVETVPTVITNTDGVNEPSSCDQFNKNSSHITDFSNRTDAQQNSLENNLRTTIGDNTRTQSVPVDEKQSNECVLNQNDLLSTVALDQDSSNESFSSRETCV